MIDRSRQSKLAELRAKTDGDLANVINHELALGIALTSAHEFNSEDYEGAEQAYANATKFLTKLDDPAELAALHTKTKQLRNAINGRKQTGHA